MKGIAFVSAAILLIAGGVSASFDNTGGKASVSISMDDPEKAAKAGGTFISEIGSAAQGIYENVKARNASCKTDEKTLYRIRTADCDPKSQIGAYYNYKAAKNNCPQGYCIFNQYDTLLYIPERSS
ncbi:MAG: hypothetical protein K5705_00010 [Oscillospiraceae bacterium]|nr:hypothetical protein [Oscillospiraceae bacterium]